MAPTSTKSADDVLAESLPRVLAVRERPGRPGPLSASLTHFWRAMLGFKHGPGQLIDMILFPFIFLLVFTFLFGGAIGGSTGAYLQDFLPGILVQTVVMMSVYTGTALNTDIVKGIFDRFRTLSFWQPATIVGSLMADMVRYVIALTLTIAAGMLIGFRPSSLFGCVLAVLVLILFAFSVSWVFAALGVIAKAPETVSSLSMIVMFPLVFASNVFVPTESMPGVMRAIAEVNPISVAATAARGLMHGTVTAGQITWVVLISAGILAVFGPLTMYLYGNKNNH
ncbi:ABC transporter permease [Amycolatopsis sp.]|jgi:ABC-2 type transport system permease protein|uniref:ABC transporter permease n=1 Tax=Amycolatopsis sp. TaxID=37632 RepID=UPI002DF9020E|nr:ABC transporter permease [Amycolatopsis sp.]